MADGVKVKSFSLRVPDSIRELLEAQGFAGSFVITRLDGQPPAEADLKNVQSLLREDEYNKTRCARVVDRVVEIFYPEGDLNGPAGGEQGGEVCNILEEWDLDLEAFRDEVEQQLVSVGLAPRTFEVRREGHVIYLVYDREQIEIDPEDTCEEVLDAMRELSSGISAADAWAEVVRAARRN